MGALELLLVRHGESIGNLARGRAERSGEHDIASDVREADVVLSPTGQQQAARLGRWLGQLPADQRPDALWVSPYTRARTTADIATASAQLQLTAQVDERLRDRDMGALAGLTGAGISARYPAERERWRWDGKFYYRPPQGESWTDVALRVRSVLADIDRNASGQRVLVVSHDAVVLLIRYVCEQLTEQQVLTLSREAMVANASVTRLVRTDPDSSWRLDVFNDTGHLAGPA